MDDDDFEYAERRVAGPAVGLIVTSALCGGLLLLALAFDVWLLASGAAGRMPQPRGGMPKESQVAIRAGWGFLMLVTNVVIFAGALRMKQLRGRGLAKLACALALVPCLGPCFILGIPFGIWGITALADRDVRRAFED